MKNIIRSLCGGLLLIGLAACGNKAKKVGALGKAEIIASVEELGTAQNRSDLNDELALKVLGLFEPGEYHWESRTGENGNYEFRGLGFDDSPARIERVVLNGLHMRGSAGPYVDSIVVAGLVSEQSDGNWVQKLERGQVFYSEEFWDRFGTFNAKLISPLTALEALLQMARLSDANSAGYFEGLTVKVNKGLTVDAEFLGWVPGEEVDEISFRLDDFEYALMANSGLDNGRAINSQASLSLSAAQMSAVNIKPKDINLKSSMDFNLAAINPFERSFDSLIIDDLDVVMDGLTIDIPTLVSGLNGNVKTSFSRGTTIPAFSLGFDREPQNPSFSPLYEIFTGMGLDSWDFSYSSKVNLDVKKDTANVDHIRLIMKDGAQLNVDYEISGFQNYDAEMKNIRNRVKEAREQGEVLDFETVETNYAAAMSQISLGRLNIDLDDNSLLEKTLNTMATNQDVSLDVARQQAKAYAMLITLGIDDPYLSELAEDFAVNAQKFVLKGGGMKFTVNPEAGFKLGPAIVEAETAEDATVKQIYGPLNADFEHVPEAPPQ